MFAHMRVCKREGVSHTENRLEALVFTSEGDIRNVVNNLQSTHMAFRSACVLNFYKVCDASYPTGARLSIARPKAGLGRAVVESPPGMEMLILTREKNIPFARSLPCFLVQRSGCNGRQQLQRQNAPQTVDGLFTTEPDFQSELSKISVPRRKEYPTQKLTPQVRQKERSRTPGKEQQSFYSGENLGKEKLGFSSERSENVSKKKSLLEQPRSWYQSGRDDDGRGKCGAVIR